MGRGQRGQAVGFLAVAIGAGCMLASASVASAAVQVTAGTSSLEVKLDGAASDIVVSGSSDSSVTLSVLSASGPLFGTSAGGGASCQGDGSRLVTCTTSGAFPAITVTDDGSAGPKDSVDASSSPVLISTGGAGGTLSSPIAVKGSAFNDVLHGSAGADEITGGEGHDEIFGLAGTDTIDAFDGYTDRVDCGDDLDAARVDAADTMLNCEYPTVVVDGDADGYFVGEDCDDHDPKIRPGATDVPGNGVDEDCSGADARFPDADADGIAEPEDCDDKDAKIRPGALEIVGNKIDENCDGVVAPFPPIGSSVHSSFQVLGGKTKVVDLTVTDIPQGATIVLTCNSGHHGHSTSSNDCPFSKRSFGFGRGPRQSTDLSGSFNRRKLKAGTVITVTITAPQTIGRQVQFKTRKGKEPSISGGCLQPGGRAVLPCGSFNGPSGVR
jgi:hypothetical protein